MRSLTKFKAFRKIENICLLNWTHLLFKVKGDGRTYNLVLNTPGQTNLTANNIYTYPLYTRGGPYWQYSKIPISKLINGSYGRITDVQHRVPDYLIENIGITIMDNIEGNFSLEIDYIGLVRDNNAVEDHSYELYKTPKYVGNT